MTPRQQEIYDAYLATGSKREVARKYGMNESSVREIIKRAKRHLEMDPAVSSAMSAAGMQDADILHSGWIKTETASLYFQVPQADTASTVENLREAFDGMTLADRIMPPADSNGDLCTVYPLMDVHLGMQADAGETGAEDYSTEIATKQMRMAFAQIMALTPQSRHAILIIGGDFFHANDQTNQTPAHKHQLDVSSRHWRVLDAGVTLLAEVIETLAERHQNVRVKVLRGNHDIESHMVLTFALAERYRLTDHIDIDRNPRDLFMARWGKCLIAAHHGDKAPPERLTLYLSDVCPYWSETRHRYCLTGHVHKDQSRDVGPLRWESLRAFTPPDAYAAGMGYAGRRAMQALTFHRDRGMVLRAIDPIEACDNAR